jgi:aspartyl-tRNA(Asn)/glutamyl-tRNA(Gln) amidotransferase subunit B
MNRNATEYEATIGLEVHAELRTRTKMFCDSRNDADEMRPNVNVCPVCMAHPGTLPVINREAVRHVLCVGLAIGAKIADYTEFDRKNYFYPDLPKGYQISQYEHPLVTGGSLAGVAITRIHLEEDTASSMHDDATGQTTIDYNRAGVPLMELVTEPVMRSAEEAGNFGRELQLLLRTLGVSDANMEKGEMRVEANVSVAHKGERSAVYVEIKNLNSFRTMERAVRYEIERQKGCIEAGETLVKETLGWDEKKQVTFPQRTKEGSADYRYFPDPDLPSLRLSEIPGFDTGTLAQSLPELPAERKERYMKRGVQADAATLFVRDTRYGSLFESVAEEVDAESALVAANYIANDLVKIVRDIEDRDARQLTDLPVSALHLSELVRLVREKRVSSRAAKDILAMVAAGGGAPGDIVREQGLEQVQSEEALERVIDEVIAAHPAVADEVRAGKAAALEYLIGQCMKALRGAADPIQLRASLQKRVQG